MQESEIKERLAKRLKPSRYAHSLGVVETSVALARRFGVDEQKAALAALLHDCGREYPEKQLIYEAERLAIPLRPIERELPFLLHAPVGAARAAEFYGVNDEEVLSAIRRHTVGGSGMNDLDKIIFFADMIEPNRRYPGVEELRQMAAAATTLDEILLEALTQTIAYVLEEGGLLHPDTVIARNEIILKQKRRSNL